MGSRLSIEDFCKKLDPSSRSYQSVKEKMDTTIKAHPNTMCRPYSSYTILEISEINNETLLKNFNIRANYLSGYPEGLNEKLLFHGTPNYFQIIRDGFDVSFSRRGRQMFGRGIYFAEDSSKANQYVHKDCKCSQHGQIGCYMCDRYLLLCRVMLGATYEARSSVSLENIEAYYDSISAIPSEKRNLKYKEYVVRRSDHIYPAYLIKYRINEPNTCRQIVGILSIMCFLYLLYKFFKFFVFALILLWIIYNFNK